MKIKEIYKSPQCEAFELDMHALMTVSAEYNGFNNNGGNEDAEW